MRVGITGHQERKGIDWDWVRSAINQEFARRQIENAFSSLAIGSDQVFAQAALNRNISLTAVIPFEQYEDQFKLPDRQSYKSLLAGCDQVLILDWPGDRQLAFLNAGRFIVGVVDVMFAVWDGKKAGGTGGTADIVSFARSNGKPVIHIDPIRETIGVIGTV
jgi:hypothetical protein